MEGEASLVALWMEEIERKINGLVEAIMADKGGSRGPSKAKEEAEPAEKEEAKPAEKEEAEPSKGGSRAPSKAKEEAEPAALWMEENEVIVVLSEPWLKRRRLSKGKGGGLRPWPKATVLEFDPEWEEEKERMLVTSEDEEEEVLGKGEEEAEPAKKEEAEQSKHPSLPITDSKIAQASYIRLRQRLEDAQLRGFLDFSGPPTEKPVPVEGEVETEGEEVEDKDEGEEEPTELPVPLDQGWRTKGRGWRTRFLYRNGKDE